MELADKLAVAVGAVVVFALQRRGGSCYDAVAMNNVHEHFNFICGESHCTPTSIVGLG